MKLFMNASPSLHPKERLFSLKNIMMYTKFAIGTIFDLWCWISVIAFFLSTLVLVSFGFCAIWDIPFPPIELLKVAARVWISSIIGAIAFLIGAGLNRYWFSSYDCYR